MPWLLNENKVFLFTFGSENRLVNIFALRFLYHIVHGLCNGHSGRWTGLVNIKTVGRAMEVANGLLDLIGLWIEVTFAYYERVIL